LNNLDHEAVLEVFEGIPQFQVAKADLAAGINILDLLAVQTQVFPSKGEARKMLQGGGVSINREKATDIEESVTENHLVNNKYIVAQRGKKNYYLIIAD
jgi:tyrosyl-tRNA synthetase